MGYRVGPRAIVVRHARLVSKTVTVMFAVGSVVADPRALPFRPGSGRLIKGVLNTLTWRLR